MPQSDDLRRTINFLFSNGVEESMTPSSTPPETALLDGLDMLDGFTILGSEEDLLMLLSVEPSDLQKQNTAGHH